MTNTTTIHAYAADAPGAPFQKYSYQVPKTLAPDEVEIQVTSCGLCHSDLSMWQNHWEMTAYPFVPGHEVIGKIAQVGPEVHHLKPGQTVGLGWFSRSDLNCPQCLSGDHNLCPANESTIVQRHGGFADRIRCQATWAIPLPTGLSADELGPLFCGGITVFNPIVQNQISPTDRVAVVGIGGLGHLALRFLRAWGCEVTAFSTSPNKEAEARKFGAHHFHSTHDERILESLAGTYNLILVTVNANLNWPLYVNALAPKGKLHMVGAAEQIQTPVFPMILGQKSVGGSPLGSPATISRMLDFAARHGIAPQTEHFPLDQINQAFHHLKSGQARYRIILDVA